MFIVKTLDGYLSYKSEPVESEEDICFVEIAIHAKRFSDEHAATIASLILGDWLRDPIVLPYEGDDYLN